MPYFFGDQWNRFCADHADAVRERDALQAENAALRKRCDQLEDANERLIRWWPTWEAHCSDESQETSNSVYRITDTEWGLTHDDDGALARYPSRTAAIYAMCGITQAADAAKGE